jgi:hypothetical protein
MLQTEQQFLKSGWKSPIDIGDGETQASVYGMI